MLSEIFYFEKSLARPAAGLRRDCYASLPLVPSESTPTSGMLR
jgi:hypothetical protein